MAKIDELLMCGLRILLVDDEARLADAIEAGLRNEGAEISRAGNLRDAIQRFSAFGPDLVITDLNLPDGNGLELLRRWRQEQPSVPIILITAHSGIDSAITALQLGAFDYLAKPFDMESLIAAVRRAAEVGNLRRKVSQYEGREKGREPLTIIGESDTMQKFKKLLLRVAQSKSDTILIHGESGTGKELAARALHDWSQNADAPFVEINCACIPETLIESELFGFEKGSFTDAKEKKLGLFEVVKNGTLFLDEIGELPIKLQAKLLRVIEYRRFKRIGGIRDIEFSGRIVAATNRKLEEQITNGDFRSDLFYRLNIVPLVVPPLRDRSSDIPALVDYLLEKVSNTLSVGKPTMSHEAMGELVKYRWPGNIRELRNVLQRTIVFHQPEMISLENLELQSHAEFHSCSDSTLNHASEQMKAESIGADKSREIFRLPEEGIHLEDLEKSLLTQALEKARFNQTKAAQLLKITRHTLRYRLEKFGLLTGPM